METALLEASIKQLKGWVIDFFGLCKYPFFSVSSQRVSLAELLE